MYVCVYLENVLQWERAMELFTNDVAVAGGDYRIADDEGGGCDWAWA